MSPIDLERIKELAQKVIDTDFPADMEYGAFGAAKLHYAALDEFNKRVTPTVVLKLVAEVEALRAEIIHLTTEQVETEKQLTDEITNQKIGRLRVEADLTAARAALEKIAGTPPWGNLDQHVAKDALARLGAGEALAAVREAQEALAIVEVASVLMTERGDVRVNARNALARLRAVFGKKL